MAACLTASRAVALLRRGTGASWRDALGAFFIWQSTSLVVARASVVALFARKAAFLRTPKTSEKSKWWEALRANWAESVLALLGVIGIGCALSRAAELAGLLLAGLLVFPTLGLAAAPVNSWAAQRAALPADMREWRTSEWKRTADRRAFVRGAATGGVLTVGAVIVAAVALMLTPAKHPVQPPSLVAPPSHQRAPTHQHLRRHSPAPSTPSPSMSSTPPVSPSPGTSSPAPSPSASHSSPSASPTATP